MDWTSGPYAHVMIALSTLAYCAAASAFTLKTLLEGYAARVRWDLWRILGVVLCLVWPVLVIWLLVLARRARAPQTASEVARPTQPDSVILKTG